MCNIKWVSSFKHQPVDRIFQSNGLLANKETFSILSGSSGSHSCSQMMLAAILALVILQEISKQFSFPALTFIMGI